MRKILKEDYESLAKFRRALREFLHFTEDSARQFGLTPQQHQALLAVKGQEGQEWSSVGKVAEFLQIKPHAAVGLVDRCQAAGLLVRASDEHDRRVVRLSLTEKGEDVLEKITLKNRTELRTLRRLAEALNTADVG